MKNENYYKKYIATVKDFPIEGIMFRDITPTIQNEVIFKDCIDDLAEIAIKYDFNKIICAEARGFVFGSALSYKLGKSLIMARKPGKLPRPGLEYSYTLEYGKNTLIISEEKPQEIIYSGNISSQRGNVNQSSTINETNVPSSIKITRKIVTSQPVTETHVTKTKVITTTTRGGMPATTKITNYNNIASNNISSVNKTKTTTTPTTTNNYTRPKITSTVTYNKVGTIIII